MEHLLKEYLMRGTAPGLALTLAFGLAACGGGDTSSGPASGADPLGEDEQVQERLQANGSVFGDEGILGAIQGPQRQGDALPVNKFLWRASLDTLSFLPLASTDPFTGVIATDWGASPTTPGERFKVTAYMVRPALAASSLKVAVYREVRNAGGIWVPAAVDPETSRKLEDAILTRARQIRIAEVAGSSAG